MYLVNKQIFYGLHPNAITMHIFSEVRDYLLKRFQTPWCKFHLNEIKGKKDQFHTKHKGREVYAKKQTLGTSFVLNANVIDHFRQIPINFRIGFNGKIQKEEKRREREV